MDDDALPPDDDHPHLHPAAAAAAGHRLPHARHAWPRPRRWCRTPGCAGTRSDTTQVDNAEAWLVTVTTRLAIDRLRAAKLHRERYAGLWLPEPLLIERPHTPEEMLERADDMSVALLMVLERLSPEARAAFLLREVFEADYAELARTIGKSEAACRQLVHRAKAQLERGAAALRGAARHPPARAARLRRRADAGDFAGLRAMLDDEAELIGDGGGQVPSFPQADAGRPAHRAAVLRGLAAPRRGRARAARRAQRRMGAAALLRRARWNRRRPSRPTASASCASRCSAIPLKLARIAAALGG